MMTTPYPASTELKNHFSIFHLAVRHKVDHKTFGKFYPRLEQHHWQLHDFLSTNPFAPVSKKSESQRAFLPQKILTPYAFDSLFGKTWMDDEKWQTVADKSKAVLQDRLNPNGKIVSHPENVLLTQSIEQPWLNCALCFKYQKRLFTFQIEWVDLWLFNDYTGILAFKTKLEQVEKAGKSGCPTVDDLNFFNRIIRHPGSSMVPNKVQVRSVDDAMPAIKLWETLIYEQCLGLNDQNVLLLDNQSREDILDRYTRYAKLLTFAQIGNIASEKEEFLWNRPITNPDFTATANYDQFTRGENSLVFDAYQRGMLAGYPTVRDMLLLELATVSGEGKTWAIDKAWQFDTNHVTKLFQDSGIKIWAYWNGLALRDICAFLVFDDSVQLHHKQKQQVESYYYPLYVHTYHQRFRLDCFSQDIIDHGLHDCVKSRKILEDFNAFYNQYWFKEVTVDFQGVEIADRMKAGFSIDNKYQVVKEEVKDVTSFIDSKIQAGRQALLAILILAFYPLQYFGLGDMIQELVKKDFWWFIGLNAGFIILILLFGRYLLPKFFGFFCRMLAKFYPKGVE